MQSPVSGDPSSSLESWWDMKEDGSKSLSLLPSVEMILSDDRLAELSDEPRPLVRAWARESLAELRREIRAGTYRPSDRKEALTRVVTHLRDRAETRLEMHLRDVWNATGVLLHTNLGRAVLPEAARRALMVAASGYSSLEIDLETGKRASRNAAVRELIPLLTGAEAGFAVTNNAAALFLTMASLASGREVLVSRGELVEIGGSFRLPDILQASGARLKEVGTTNRTRIDDYRLARSAETALVLHVHRSNFRLEGFSEDPDLNELVGFCRDEGLPLVHDIGSGALRQHRDLFPDEPVVEDVVDSGADVVCFSADKLLGLGQAGIIAGRKELVEDRIGRHPIARVVRLDKTLLATLEAGLRIQLKGPEVSRREIPLLRALSRDTDEIKTAVERCAGSLRERLSGSFEIGSVEVQGEVGGGTLPGVTFPSHAVTVSHTGTSVNKLAADLRSAHPSVIGRIHEDHLLLDLRAIEEEDESAFLEAVVNALGGRG